jgi:hypothetical protein
MIEAIDHSLRVLMQNQEEKFGGLPLVFTGDFFQLDPVGKEENLIHADDSFDLWF